jgi:DnaK suppressor protein
MAQTRKSRRSAKSLEAVKTKLEAERDELRHQIAELERHTEGEPDVFDEDRGEPETATYERERDLSLYTNARDLLDKVEHALARIDDGTYGVCESCGKSIEAARLRALPHASLCISCKRAEERG